jgi:hypothetical protein
MRVDRDQKSDIFGYIVLKSAKECYFLEVEFTLLERQSPRNYQLQNYEILSMGIFLIFMGTSPEGRCFLYGAADLPQGLSCSVGVF